MKFIEIGKIENLDLGSIPHLIKKEFGRLLNHILKKYIIIYKPGEKEKKIIETFEYLYNTVNYNFYELDELEDNNDYDF